MLSIRNVGTNLTKNIDLGRKILYRTFIGLSFIALASCGKKVEDGNKGSGSQRYDIPVSSDLDQTLQEQQLSCEPGSVCPNYMGLVNVVEKGKIRSCTGFLVARDIMATSASCLPSILRLAEQDCSKDVHFYFAGMTSREKTVRVACKKVLGSSDLKGSSPVRWRDDVAYLKIDGDMLYRRNLYFSRQGFEDQKTYQAWYVSKVDDKTFFIKKNTCKNIQASYINPFASSISSPNILLSDCELDASASGAPLLDKRGQVRGVVSNPMDNQIADYLSKTGLLAKPLSKIYHGTSFACAPTIYDSQVLDEVECLKDMSQLTLDEERFKLLNPRDFFDRSIPDLEKMVNKLSNYLFFKVRLFGEGDEKQMGFEPVCFRPLKDWINNVENTSALVTDFTFPTYKVKKALDSYGRLIANVSNDEKPIKYHIQFNVRNLKRYANSKVFFWNDVFNTNYPRITESCI